MPRPLDRAKVRAALQAMPRETLLKILDRVVARTHKADLAILLKGFASLAELRDGTIAARPLLKAVKLFRDASLNREYYDEFRVDSKNFMRKSAGTKRWIDNLGRFMDCCVAQATVGPPKVVRGAFEVLFDLVRRIDHGDEWLFFADEGGSWMFGLDHRTVLPSYFKVLSATAKPEAYAKAAQAAGEVLLRHDQDRALALARAAASPEQRRVLDGPTHTP